METEPGVPQAEYVSWDSPGPASAGLHAAPPSISGILPSGISPQISSRGHCNHSSEREWVAPGAVFTGVLHPLSQLKLLCLNLVSEARSLRQLCSTEHGIPASTDKLLGDPQKEQQQVGLCLFLPICDYLPSLSTSPTCSTSRTCSTSQAPRCSAPCPHTSLGISHPLCHCCHACPECIAQRSWVSSP